MASKYTVYGSEKIDTKIDKDLKTISSAVQSEFDSGEITALILGGGYGRGEGGVFLEKGQEQLFNDYDLFVVIPNCSRKKRNKIFDRLQKVSHELEQVISIEVDFSVPLRENEICDLPFYLIWYELKNGYHVFYEDDQILVQMPDYEGSKIPIMEGLKLLLNRAAGLLLARRRIEHRSELNCDDREFIFRNIQKAIQAAGDTYLMTKNNYHFSYQKRQKLLTKYGDDEIIDQNGFIDLYHKSIQYKLKPFSIESSRSQLKKLLEQIFPIYEQFYLRAFAEYFGNPIMDWQKYLELISGHSTNDSFKDRLKNLYLNFKIDGLRNPVWKWYTRYPRFHLFYAVPFVIFSFQKNNGNLETVLPSNIETNSEKAFIQLWQRYN